MTDTASEATFAKIVESPLSLDTSYTCDVCGAQGWVEVELMVPNDKGVRVKDDLIFCAHDYQSRNANLERVATRIVDHRLALRRMEGRA